MVFALRTDHFACSKSLRVVTIWLQDLTSIPYYVTSSGMAREKEKRERRRRRKKGGEKKQIRDETAETRIKS